MRFDRIVWLATVSVAAAGLLAELGDYLLRASEPWVEAFSLSYEGNLPTWYASSLLLLCGLRIGELGARVPMHGSRWRVLSGVFVFMSLDEAIEIHEHLAGVIPSSDISWLHFSWVIPASIFVALFGLVMWPMVRELPLGVKRRFVAAAVLYVGGALCMELPLGYVADRFGDDNLLYGCVDWLEEALELTGATLFLVSLGAYGRTFDD
ncbi:MAG: hypothetical protein ACI9KE_005378 [Polyangiales bacterium]|jgi:hypothetical protein